MQCDVIIVGGGPAGLAFARALDDCGLETVLVERQSEEAIARPRYDGREIALTHGSAAILQRLGAWERFGREDVAPLRAARVRNGRSLFGLDFLPPEGGDGPLGFLVSNHRIRQALYETVKDQAQLRIVCGVGVEAVRAEAQGAHVVLSNGQMLRGRLLVAADSRFSGVRAQLGIAAEINRLGRSMLVCRVQHAKPHDAVATEWFGYRQTLALLPLLGNASSAVLTLPEDLIARLAALSDRALGEELTRRSEGLLGAMEVVGSRHVYPLATTWSRHFAATRAALIGDAAVGMHPVTAHGFNLGLGGAALLAGGIREAARQGRDPGRNAVLRAYERRQRAAAWPIYTATNLLVGLYTRESPMARTARHAVLRLGARLPFFQTGIRNMLMAH